MLTSDRGSGAVRLTGHVSDGERRQAQQRVVLTSDRGSEQVRLTGPVSDGERRLSSVLMLTSDRGSGASEINRSRERRRAAVRIVFQSVRLSSVFMLTSDRGSGPSQIDGARERRRTAVRMSASVSQAQQRVDVDL
ncbi:hypothetical protein J6590_008966 [Homalodisca vitripennis]|nr:hypothetical protein J6590_008966 [Homalodisca vitripennis]